MSERIAHAAAKPAFSRSGGAVLQRKCACGTHTHGGIDCPACSGKKRTGLQTKLQVDAQGDVYEQEADRIADRITTVTTGNSGNALAYGIRRLPARSTETTESVPASADRALASSGKPLQPELREQLEHSFGHDFSSVRIHEGGQASESAQAVHAQAYTAGSHVVFNQGQFAPQTPAGKHLLAHELVHVIQQGASDRNISVLQRKAPPGAEEQCRIHHGASAYIYFEVARRFNDPTDSDPRVLVRARCLKKAFGQLDARSAIQFAQQIMKREGIYADYMRLHHATRLEIAEILVDRINQKDTASYEARLLTGDVFVPPDSPESPAPKIAVNAVAGGIVVKPDKPVLALGNATLFGPAECSKFTFGFTQFIVEEQLAQEFHFPKLDSYLVFDNGASMRPMLPCYDVFNSGDVWSYKQKMKCDSADAVKGFGDDQPLFEDTPKTPFVDGGSDDLLPSTFKWRDKFVTVFYATLPNNAVHFFSWFDWTIAYCKTFPHTAGRMSLTDLPADKAAREVVINPVRSGAPIAALAAMAGKPAPRACNTLARSTSAVTSRPDKSSVKCP